MEGLLRKIDESHRMIIVLTDSYVNDSWSRFEAQQVGIQNRNRNMILQSFVFVLLHSLIPFQGYTSMLKNRTKLIVIRTPGVKSALKKVYQKQVFIQIKFRLENLVFEPSFSLLRYCI